LFVLTVFVAWGLYVDGDVGSCCGARTIAERTYRTEYSSLEACRRAGSAARGNRDVYLRLVGFRGGDPQRVFTSFRVSDCAAAATS